MDSENMKQLMITGYGGMSKLKLMDRPMIGPKSDEVLIEVVCTSINPVDYKIRKGFLFFAMSPFFPKPIGFDVAGIVKEVGKTVKNFQKGARVNFFVSIWSVYPMDL